MSRKDRIEIGDGAGGELMQKMLGESVIPLIRPSIDERTRGLDPDLLDDSASHGDLAFTIDGHTIWPLEFPGGDIGGLAVYGTVNDLAVVGAVPEVMALSMVIEEGLDRSLLERIASSIGSASERTEVRVITGDTKVVERGGVKGLVVTTAGIGRRHHLLDRCLERAGDIRSGCDTMWLRDDAPRPGDHIILTGSVGDHGISLLSFREGFGFEVEVESDLAPLADLMGAAITEGGVVAAKDLTRGGLANGLNEWNRKCGLSILVSEERIPVKEPVRTGCEMLGLDPYEIGNEGKAILCVVPGAEEEVLRAVRRTTEGRDARLIGRVLEAEGPVILETSIGGKRIMDAPYGDPVPRIC